MYGLFYKNVTNIYIYLKLLLMINKREILILSCLPISSLVNIISFTLNPLSQNFLIFPLSHNKCLSNIAEICFSLFF